MTLKEQLAWRGTLVFGSAILYWVGVFIQGRRVRKRIGRQPNLKPRTRRERLLWAGWMTVVGCWLALPFLARVKTTPWLAVSPPLVTPATFAAGVFFLVAGYIATLWCYAAMGDAWRIGINQKEKNDLITRGPYQWIRHPIYGFQVVMLLGVAFLLPSIPAVCVLALHYACLLAKARDEEVYLLGLHGDVYRDYVKRTGRLLPRLL